MLCEKTDRKMTPNEKKVYEKKLNYVKAFLVKHVLPHMLPRNLRSTANVACRKRKIK